MSRLRPADQAFLLCIGKTGSVSFASNCCIAKLNNSPQFFILSRKLIHELNPLAHRDG